jgi:hypothetical protein
MKPEGRKVVKFPCKRDVHPKKGWVNWWETISGCVSRNVRKLNIKREVEKELWEEEQ